MTDHLFLCYFGDGSYWTDTIYLPALPSGVSYIHEFRYDSKWISPGLQRSGLEKTAKKGGLIGRKVYLGARFLDPPRATKVLPIREATITHVRYSDNLYQFYFVLGPLIKFERNTKISSYLIEVGALPAGAPQGALAFESTVTAPTLAPEEDQAEYQAWEAFADLVGSGANAIFHERARKSIFIRIKRPRVASSGGVAKAKRIRDSATSAPLYGFRLSEHVEYELPVFYRVPSLMSGDETPGDFSITPDVSSDQIGLSSKSLHVVGNYGSRDLGLTALGSTSPVELTLNLPKDIKGQSGSDLYSANLVTFVRGTFSLGTAVKRRWLPNLLLFLSLFTLGAVSLGQSLLSPYLQGTIDEKDLIVKWPLFLIMVLASAIATLAIQAFRSKD